MEWGPPTRVGAWPRTPGHSANSSRLLPRWQTQQWQPPGILAVPEPHGSRATQKPCLPSGAVPPRGRPVRDEAGGRNGRPGWGVRCERQNASQRQNDDSSYDSPGPARRLEGNTVNQRGSWGQLQNHSTIKTKATLWVSRRKRISWCYPGQGTSLITGFQ